MILNYTANETRCFLLCCSFPIRNYSELVIYSRAKGFVPLSLYEAGIVY